MFENNSTLLEDFDGFVEKLKARCNAGEYKTNGKQDLKFTSRHHAFLLEMFLRRKRH